MKTTLLLLALAVFATDWSPAYAALAATRGDAPERLVKMRRHLRHQAKMRLRQYRHH